MHSLDEPAGGAVATRTAVIVQIPAAEALVDRHRQRLDRAAGWGVPAHVTVLYPFLAPDAVTEQAVRKLAEAVSGVAAFDCAFETTGWFDADFLWLRPRPEEPLRRLTLAVWQAFPDHPPYGGVHPGVQPHLTVAERSLSGADGLGGIEAELHRGLPVYQRIDHVLLIAGSDRPRSWRTLHRIDLGSSSSPAQPWLSPTPWD